MDIVAVQARLQATRDVQSAIAPQWTWQEKTLEQWDLDLARFTELLEAESIAKQTEINVRTQRNAFYRALAQRTMQSVALLKVAARNNPAHAELLAKLPSTPNGNPQVLARAQAASDAWKQTMPHFAPTPDLTQANLEGAILDCRTLDAQTSEWKVKWRLAAETLQGFAEQQERDTKAWYQLATRLFAAGSVQGELIRGRVPTSYRRPTPKEHLPTSELASLTSAAP